MNRTLLFFCLFSFVSCSLFAQADFDNANHIASADSPAVKKKTEARKSAIKLYPNPSYGKISVSANTSTSLHFYIFDLEGTLVYQAVLNNKEKKTVDNLKKGTYLYDVFENDESIEEGKILVK